MSAWSKKNGSDFNSSNIDTIDYDDGTEVLSVGFISGGTYLYQKVDENTATAMANAESKTKFLNETLKGRFQFEKA